jgi:hypothetical protein
MEDIPDHHEALFFTEWRSRWSWQFSASSNSYPKPKAEGTIKENSSPPETEWEA